MLAGSAVNAMKRQGDAVVKEAQAAGWTLRSRKGNEHEATGAGVVGGAVASLLGGTVSTTGLQVFGFDGGVAPATYVQPYAGTMALPGEHHMIVPGNLTASVTVVPSWWSRQGSQRLYWMLVFLTLGLFALSKVKQPKVVCDDPTLLAQLQGSKQVARAFGALQGDWAVGMSVIELPWVLQVRARGDGMSHVVLAAGRYGGLTTFKVGVKAFDTVTRLLVAGMSAEPVAAQPWREPVQYEAAPWEA